MFNCCICGKISFGHGNNPRGALNENGERIEFKTKDKCCNACYDKYVIAGRLEKMYGIKCGGDYYAKQIPKQKAKKKNKT